MVDFPLLVRKFAEIPPSPYERTQQLEVENASLESRLKTVQKRNQRLNDVVEGNDVKLGDPHSKVEDQSRFTLQLEEKVNMLEEKLQAAQFGRSILAKCATSRAVLADSTLAQT